MVFVLVIKLRPFIEVKWKVEPAHQAVNFAQIVLWRHCFKTWCANIAFTTRKVFGGCGLEEFIGLVTLTFYAASGLFF